MRYVFSVFILFIASASYAQDKVFSTGLKSPPDLEARILKSEKKHSRTLQALPIVTATKFDCRELGMVGPVKNQDECGSCHLCSATDTVECGLFRTGHARPDGSFALSWQHVLDCADTGGCNGGWPEDTFEYAKRHGIATLAEYGPYTARERQCKNTSSMKLFKISDYGYVGKSSGVPSTQAIKDAMTKFGPICVALAADNRFMNMAPGSVFKGGATGINHAVMLVGWDDAKGSKGAWILRNSWGKNWVDGGYCWIEYGANQVGYGAMWCAVNPLPPPPDPIPPGPGPGPLPPTGLKGITLNFNDGKNQSYDVLPTGTADKIRELFRLLDGSDAMPARVEAPAKPCADRDRMDRLEKNLSDLTDAVLKMQKAK